ncbi:MAG: hypothetical protein AAF597_09145, partial [Bacteroidota bacterium]
MLTHFYQDIIHHLSEALKGLGLGAAQFGLEKTNQTTPFFEVSGETFRVKAPAFQKTSGEVRWVQRSEQFTLSESEAERVGSYSLQVAPEGLIGAWVTTAPGSPGSTVLQLTG